MSPNFTLVGLGFYDQFRHVVYDSFFAAFSAVAVSAAVAGGASLQISGVHSNGMLLRRKMADPVCGRATPGAALTILFAGRTIHTKSSSRAADDEALEA